MKYIDSTDNPVVKKDIHRFMYDADGIETSEEKKALAQLMTENFTNGTSKSKYFINTFNGVLYDPLGTDSTKKRRDGFNLKEVSSDTFQFYLMYLNSKNGLYLTRAQRSFIDG